MWRYKNKSPPISNYSDLLRSETKGFYATYKQADELNKLNELFIFWSESKNKFSIRFLKCTCIPLDKTCMPLVLFTSQILTVANCNLMHFTMWRNVKTIHLQTYSKFYGLLWCYS